MKRDGSGYVGLDEVTKNEYLNFVKGNKFVIFENVAIPVGRKSRKKKFAPDKFELETTSVWSYPRRGRWATHKGDFHGNWSPQVVRNIILHYSDEKDTVLDQMVGSGTTLIESKLLNRKGIGVDLNRDAIILTQDRLNFDYIKKPLPQKTYVGDARNLDLIKDSSIDLICTHPPYANIISYSEDQPADLSSHGSVDDFIEAMKEVAQESYRVLQQDKYCAILMGDIRRNKHYIPLSARVMEAFLDCGFILKEDVIKKQWQCKATGFWKDKAIENNFLLIMHEHLFIFRKPGKEDTWNMYQDSRKWWP